MKILVTGGLGVVGIPLVRELNRRGHEVRVCDLTHSEGPHYIRCDVSRYRQMERIFDAHQFDYVYHLAAYARFRILVLHALRGYSVEAQAVYDTLQSNFPEGQPGHASALLGEAFWQAFQVTQDVGQACNQALESMADPDEIIYWLSGYHGFQSPNYQPVDLCPFGQTGTR